MTPQSLDLLLTALRAPSYQQDSAWHDPKAVYATKPRALLDDAAATIATLASDEWLLKALESFKIEERAQYRPLTFAERLLIRDFIDHATLIELEPTP